MYYTNTVAGALAQDTPKKLYFYWKNHAVSKKYDFSGDISEEEFIHKYLDGDTIKFQKFEYWATTENYAKIKKLYYAGLKEQDFIAMFEAVREKALKGDNASIKTFIMLQKEIDKIKKNEVEDEDDGLEL